MRQRSNRKRYLSARKTIRFEHVEHGQGWEACQHIGGTEHRGNRSESRNPASNSRFTPTFAATAFTGFSTWSPTRTAKCGQVTRLLQLIWPRIPGKLGQQRVASYALCVARDSERLGGTDSSLQIVAVDRSCADLKTVKILHAPRPQLYSPEPAGGGDGRLVAA